MENKYIHDCRNSLQSIGEANQPALSQEAVAAGLVAVASSASCCNANILRLPEVIRRVGLKRTSIYLHMTQGKFPKQIHLGDRAVGWLESEIDAWLAVRVHARGNHEGV